MDNTIIQQGRFLSAGLPATLNLRNGVDWIRVINMTHASIPQANEGVEFFWQRGMGDDDAVVTVRNGAGTADLITTAGTLGVPGFIPVDPSIQALFGPAIAVTSTTNAVQPVVATGNTTGLLVGSVVRLSNIVGAQNISGIDFEIDTIVAATSFRVRWPLANAPGVGGAGFYRKVNFNSPFYPRNRFIVNLVTGVTTTITTSVAHGFTVGQQVRLAIPVEWGTVEINGRQGTVLAINPVTNTFTVGIDSTGATAFTYPLAAALPFSFAQVVPVGENTSTALLANTNILDDATTNINFIGITLGAGAASPAGVLNDDIFWMAGSSFSVFN